MTTLRTPISPYIAFLTLGFSCQLTQIIVIREMLVVFYGNEAAIGIILANWMVCVALGSFLGSRISDYLRDSRPAYSSVSLALAVFLPLELLLIRNLRVSTEGTAATEISPPHSILSPIFNILPTIEVGTGQYVDIFSMFFSSLMVVSVVCVMTGFQFAMCCRVSRDIIGTERGSAIGRVYVFESIGSIVAGVIFTFVLVHIFNSFHSIITVSILNIAVALMLIQSRRPVGPSLPPLTCSAAQSWTPALSQPHQPRRRFITAILAVTGVALLVCLAFSNDLNRISFIRQWHNSHPGYKWVDSKDSRYGNLTIVEREGQYSFFGNGQLLFSSPAPEDAQAFAHMALVQHERPSRLLVVGGGLNGSIREMFKHGVEHVTFLELDPTLVEFAKDYIEPDDRAILESPRVRVVYGDARLFIKSRIAGWTSSYCPRLNQRCVSLSDERKEAPFDMIILSLPDPDTFAINRLFTLEFFREAKNLLAPDGVLITGISAATVHFETDLLNRNASIYHTLKKVFRNVLVTPGLHNYFYCSDADHQISLDPELLGRRYASRSINASFWSDLHYYTWLAPFDTELVRRQFEMHPWNAAQGPLSGLPLLQEQTPENMKDITGSSHHTVAEYWINRDFKPITYAASFLVWNRLSQPVRADASGPPRRVEFFNWLTSIEYEWVFVAPAILFLGAMLHLLGKHRRIRASAYSITVCTLTTGYGSMLLVVILLFAFQIFHGYVYEKIGLIIALFMAGLAAGSHILGRIQTEPLARRWLLACELILASLGLLLPLILELSTDIVSSTLVFLLYAGLITATGMVVGMEFPIANLLYLKQVKRFGVTAGMIYGADVLGGGIGALLAGGLLVPVLGFATTCYTVTLFNMASLIAFILFYRAPAKD